MLGRDLPRLVTNSQLVNSTFILERVPDDHIPEAITKINYLFFDPPNDFDAQVDALAEALQTGLEWVKNHTRLGDLAHRWAERGRPTSQTLRGFELEEAERWIASRPRKAPQPTEETQVFIAESRRGAIRRRNVLTGSLATGLLVTLLLAGVAFWQRGIAVEQRNAAESRRVTTLAELATSQRLRRNWDAALRLSVHAMRLALAIDQGRAAISPARDALAAVVWQSDWRVTFSEHKGL